MQKYTLVWEKKNVYVPLCLVTIVGPDHYVNGKTEALNDKDRMKNSTKKGLERRKKCKKGRKRKTIFQSHNRLTSDVLEWQKVWKNTKKEIIIQRANWIFDVYNYVRQPHGPICPTRLNSRTLNGHLISYSFDVFVKHSLL